MKPRFANIGNPALRQLYLGDTEPYTPPAEELVIPLNERKSIQTLTETCCRWPIGDPQQADFHFCGKNKITGLPYCDFHARRAFQPPQPRRRDREVFAPGVPASAPAAAEPSRAGGGSQGEGSRLRPVTLCRRGRWQSSGGKAGSCGGAPGLLFFGRCAPAGDGQSAALAAIDTRAHAQHKARP